VETKAFYLRPDIPPGGRQRTLKEGEQPGGELGEPIRTYAEEAGLVMRRQSLVPYTAPALEATEFAKQHGAEMPFHHAAYRAYWDRGLDLERTDVLQGVAQEVGLDPEALGRSLAEATHREVVQAQYQEALGHGINGIPAFTIGRYLFTGAHPYEFFQQVARRVLLDREGEAAG
jgi:predicted DsbA family dithiol-disulfide isomerase